MYTRAVTRTLLVSLALLGLPSCDLTPAPHVVPPEREPPTCECPDDGVECTLELCDEQGHCVHRGDDRRCLGADECNLPACDVRAGGCVLAPRPIGTPCGEPGDNGGPADGCAQGECRPGRVVGLRNAGILELPNAPPASADGFVMDLARVDDRTGDGVDEIAVTSFRLVAFAPDELPGRVTLFDPVTGAIIWDVSGTPDNTAFGYRLQRVGDLNGDGLSDLVATERVGSEPRIDAIDGTDGHILWRYEEPKFDYMRFAPAGDQDGDGVEDLVVVLGEGLATVSGASGTLIDSAFGFYGPNVFAVGDLDGDGRRDFMCDAEPAVYRYVRVVGSATLEDLRVFDLPEQHVWVSGVVDDVDGDGQVEGVLTHSDGAVRDREARSLVTGDVLWVQHYPRSAPLSIFDIDGDRVGDLITDARLEDSPWRSLVFQSGADGTVAFEITPVDDHGAIAPISVGYLQTGDLDGNGTDDFAVGDEIAGGRVWLYASVIGWF